MPDDTVKTYADDPATVTVSRDLLMQVLDELDKGWISATRVAQLRAQAEASYEQGI